MFVASRRQQAQANKQTVTSRPTAGEQDEKVASARTGSTGPYLETLSGKCPRCRLKSCRASSLWPGHEGSGGAEKILTAPPPAESSCWAALCSPPAAAPSKFSRRHQRLCMRTNTMMLDNSSTVTEGTCQAGFRDMEGPIFEKLLRRGQNGSCSPASGGDVPGPTCEKRYNRASNFE